MTTRVYTTTQEITQAFIKDGWNEDTSFTELSLKEARERGLLLALKGIDNGCKYFKMNICGNIYNNKGKLVMFNI